MESDVIMETDDYKLIVGDTDKNEKVYHIINKYTSVVEGEFKMLPMAMSFCKKIQSALDKALEEYKNNGDAEEEDIVIN